MLDDVQRELRLVHSPDGFIFWFTTDLSSQLLLWFRHNLYMISFAVAGALLLLNVALISTLLSIDHLIG